MNSNYYFAYGANQNIKYLNKRYSNTLFTKYTLGILLNYDFKLGYSNIINKLISTVIPSKYNIVYGVIHKISDDMLKLFDKQEYLNLNVYDRIVLPILDFNGNIIYCYVYVAKDIEYNNTKIPDNVLSYKKIVLEGIYDNRYPIYYKYYIKNIFDQYEHKINSIS